MALLYQGRGYANATGLNAVETKALFGRKPSTYHWDEVLSPTDPHGFAPHLQIHTHLTEPSYVYSGRDRMRTQIKNRLLMSRQDVAAELQPSRPDRRAFVGIWPLPEGGFRIWRFEVPASALAGMIQTEGHMAPEEMLDGLGFTVASIDEVEQKLAELDIDSDLLDYPWNSDYPL